MPRIEKPEVEQLERLQERFERLNRELDLADGLGKPTEPIIDEIRAVSAEGKELIQSAGIYYKAFLLKFSERQFAENPNLQSFAE